MSKLAQEQIHELKEKIFSIHLFISKSIMALSIAAFIFLPLVFNTFSDTIHLESTRSMFFSATVVLCLGLLSQFLVLFNALDFYLKNYKNVVKGGEENLDKKIKHADNWMMAWQLISVVCLFSGLSVILLTLYINI